MKVPGLLNLLKFFSLYAAIMSSCYFEKTRNLIAYQALMIEGECVVGKADSFITQASGS